MNVALFIPTHNRPQCLIRVLEWIKDSNLTIYIGDSSRVDNKKTIEALDLGRVRVKYYHKKDWNIYDKWKFVTSKISEKYTVPCAEDDFPIWTNFQDFYDRAEKLGAGCLIGRELRATKEKDQIIFDESQEYRRWCIHNTENKLLDLQRANNPIVCTFYQFFRTDVLNVVHTHWASLKEFYPGNKMQEIIYRSSTFIQDKVYFMNTLLNVRTNEPTLRYTEKSDEAQKFRLNFWDEVKVLTEQNLVYKFLERHSELFHSSPVWDISKREAFNIVKYVIWKPMLRRMSTKHEILWKSRIKILVSAEISKSQLDNDGNYLYWKLPLHEISSRFHVELPIELMNLESFILHKKGDRQNCMNIARVMLK